VWTSVLSSLELLKPCVFDDKVIPFTKFEKHLTSLISPSQPLWSNNVLTVPPFQYDGVCLTSSILFKNFFNYIISTLSSSYSSVGLYVCSNKEHTSSAFNLRAMILSLHTFFWTALLTMLLCTSIASLFHLWKNTLYKHYYFMFHLVLSTTLHWHIEQTLHSFLSPFLDSGVFLLDSRSLCSMLRTWCYDFPWLVFLVAVISTVLCLH